MAMVTIPVLYKEKEYTVKATTSVCSDGTRKYKAVDMTDQDGKIMSEDGYKNDPIVITSHLGNITDIDPGTDHMSEIDLIISIVKGVRNYLIKDYVRD